MQFHTPGGMKTVPSAYPLSFNTTYIFKSTRVARGTVFIKHTVSKLLQT